MAIAKNIADKIKRVVDAVNQVNGGVPTQHENRIGKLENDLTDLRNLTEGAPCDCVQAPPEKMRDLHSGPRVIPPYGDGCELDEDVRQIICVCNVLTDMDGHVTGLQYAAITWAGGKLCSASSECEFGADPAPNPFGP